MCSVVHEPVVLRVGEGDDGEAELAEEDGVVEDGGFAHLGECLFVLEALAGLMRTIGFLGSVASTETTLASPMAALPVLEW